MLVCGAVITAVCLSCQIGRHELCAERSKKDTSAGGFPLPDCSCSHRTRESGK